MAFPEGLSPHPTFKVETSVIGVELQVFDGRTVPHADLIQSMMNAGACVAFGLRPSWTTDGGVEGAYKGAPIDLENLSDGQLGIINTLWEAKSNLRPRQEEATDRVLGFYEVYLATMFEQPVKIEDQWYPPEVILINPALQTRDAVWKRSIDSLAKTGGGKFARDVKRWLVNNSEASNRYLRGLTDEEIERFFVDPPDK